MKFKYLGENDSYCLELMAYGLEKKGEYLQNGQIIDVPDEYDVVINALDTSGLFERYNEPVKPSKKVEKEKK